MRLHHATAKRAEEHGVTITADEEQGIWIATKGDTSWANEDPKIALSATIFDALIRAEYPALTLIEADGYQVTANTEDGEAVRLFHDKVPPTPNDLSDIFAAADEYGINPEEGYDEDDDKRTGSVVDPAYKQQYAEAGHPNNNGDWLNQVFAELKLVTTNGKKTVTDVQGLNSLFAENGIISEDHPFGGAFHGTAPRTNGWQGRFRMSGGNMLRRVISDKGFLLAFGEKIEVPEDFAAKHRTKPRKKAKKEQPEATEAQEHEGA